MNPDIPPINFAMDAAILVAVVGLTMRGRWRLSFFFFAYLAWALIREILVVFWPERFFLQRSWLIFQPVYDVLKFGIALEVAWRTFAPFPGAASVARKASVVILGLTAVAVATLPLASPHSTTYETAVTLFHPRLNDGTIWLIAAFLAIARWYRVPVHRFHAALLTSLTLYLVFFTWVLRLYVGRDFEATRHYVNAIDPIGFLLVNCWWVHIAWRAETQTDLAHLNTLQTLERGAALSRVCSST